MVGPAALDLDKAELKTYKRRDDREPPSSCAFNRVGALLATASPKETRAALWRFGSAGNVRFDFDG